MLQENGAFFDRRISGFVPAAWYPVKFQNVPVVCGYLMNFSRVASVGNDLCLFFKKIFEFKFNFWNGAMQT
jgi:hypothetical protein